MSQDVKLTEYSHGAGCGCKISPQVLSTILQSKLDIAPDPKLLVGNSTRDDAAAYDLRQRSDCIKYYRLLYANL